MYNVLEKLRAGEELTTKDKAVHEHGLVSVLAQLHDELDAAMFDAYGWQDLAPALVGKPGGTTPLPDKPEEQAEAEEELLKRLVALNAERAAEETCGLIRWLRPEFQKSGGERTEQLEGMATEAGEVISVASKQAWPKSLSEQVQAIRVQLGIADTALTAEQLARRFTRGQKKRVAELLETLAELGQVRSDDGASYHA